MKNPRLLAIAIVAAGTICLVAYLLVNAAPEAPPAPLERFPILSRVELPRHYGYFIGDEIPLTLIVETTNGVVLDLVNLPQKGEKHGLFEIRDLRRASSPPVAGLKVYRAEYMLQYFGATPLTVPFAPLEILYALPDDRAAPANTYIYKSLRTQPVTIDISRLGPYRPTPALDLKGPVTESRSGMIWGSFTLGTGLLLAAAAGLGRAWYRHWHNGVPVAAAPTPAAQTLETLRQEGAVLYPAVVPAVPGVERLQHLIRQYLHEACGVPAHTCTTAELAGLLHDKPFCQGVVYLLERCDTLKYQAPTLSQAEERQLWWETMTLFEKLQKADMV